ncbi:MAG: thiamine phosphate synthase [Planctomycetota bacterium]
MRENDATLRLIDAAGNRACEGLRVMEDIARFTLDDRSLTERLKVLRHRVRQELGTLSGPDRLIHARNSARDVGSDVSTPQEASRDGLRGAALAAAKRGQEAMRSLEECTKTLGRSGAGFEAARYELYDLERRLIERLVPPCPQWRLCVLVTASLCQHHPPEQIVRLAADGGADCVQVREKSMDDRELLDRAGALVRASREAGIHVMVNDRPDVARLVDADGVHIGQTDLPIDAIRSVAGPRVWVGVSCSSLELAVQAVRAGADVCGLGPIFASTTKRKPALAGIELIRQFVGDEQTRGVPHLAISGIDVHTAMEVAEAGGRGVAVSSAVCAAEDPAAVCRAIIERLRHPADTSCEATMTP